MARSTASRSSLAPKTTRRRHGSSTLPPAGAGLTPVILDWNEDSASCNATPHAYGDPTDAVYRRLYLDMLSHVASVLKQDSARWRSLAYVKLSGANSRSAENRLPNGCKAGPGCICNNQQWAEAGYTPDGLYTFYREQMERDRQGFSRQVDELPAHSGRLPPREQRGLLPERNEHENLPDRREQRQMVGPFTQTQSIIDYARSTYGDDVAIAHLGLGPKPDFSDPVQYAAGTGCPLPLAPDGIHYAHGPNGVGSGCPNKWATDVGAVGGLTHFQTNHVPQTPALLASALDNMWSNSNSAMLEIYEAQAWVASDADPRSDAPPCPAAHARSVE